MRSCQSTPTKADLRGGGQNVRPTSPTSSGFVGFLFDTLHTACDSEVRKEHLIMNRATRFNYATVGALCIALAMFCSSTPISHYHPLAYTVILYVILCSLFVTGVAGIHLACERNPLNRMLNCFD